MTENREADKRITPQSKRDAHIHYVIAFCGGFLTVYPLLNVVKSFGSAQTMNFIECIHALLGKNWGAAGWHLLGAVIFAFSIVLVTVANNRKWFNTKYAALLVDVAAGFVMWKMPDNLPKIVYMYPTFVAMSFQWTSFSGSYGFAASTIFSTNNYKQMISAFAEVLFNKKPEFLLKGQFYGATLLGYNSGVACAFVLAEKLGNVCFTLVAVPAIVAGILLFTRPEEK